MENTKEKGESNTGGTETAAAGGGSILIAYFSVMETDGVDTIAGISRVAVDGEFSGNNQYIAQIIQRQNHYPVYNLWRKRVFRTIQTISELQPDATVISDGLSISRNSVAGEENDVVDRVKRLDF